LWTVTLHIETTALAQLRYQKIFKNFGPISNQEVPDNFLAFSLFDVVLLRLAFLG
jgi:hypothetical protein